MEGVDELGLLGAVLEGQYRIDRLAAGSAALLGYQGHDVARDLPVFVKIVRPIAGLTIGAAPAALTTLFERLHAEGAAAHHLGSDTPHVRRVLSAGSFPAPALGGAHVSYRIGEALRGPSLLDDLASQGRRDAATALALLDPVVLALQAGEARGFVHGEVSPRAIVLEPSLEPQQMGLAKLDDGGLARTLTVFGWEHGLGSLEGRTFDALFAAPEYFRDGQVAFSPLTDVHGLALTLLTLLLGRPPRTLPTTRSLAGVPYTPGTLGAMGVAIDDAFATVLCRALSPDPTERPQTLTSFWEALRLALSLSGAANGFTAKGTKVLPNASPLPVRAGTIPMVKRDAPVAIVESASAVGAKHDPFKIDPFAQTFGADAARPGVSPLASTVPPGKGPSQAEVLRAGALFLANGPGVGPAYAPPPVAVVAPVAPLAPVGGSVPPPAFAPEPSPLAPPAPVNPQLAGPTLRSPESSYAGEEGTPVWIWIILPIAGLAILALLAFIVALVFGWDPKFL